MRANDAARWLRKEGKPCTTGEVAHALNLSLRAARAVLEWLRQEGKVYRFTRGGDDSWAVDKRGVGRPNKTA